MRILLLAINTDLNIENHVGKLFIFNFCLILDIEDGIKPWSDYLTMRSLYEH